MKLSELKNIKNTYDDYEVVVSIQKFGSVGPSPYSKVERYNIGFDWNHNQIILIPDKTLREIGEQELESLREKYKELSSEYNKLSMYKRDLKKALEENRILKDKLEAHETYDEYNEYKVYD